MSSAVRALVSKKKKRYQEDGFDLDLTILTPNIIAMGFPSSGREASYRNPMPEVQRFLNTKYPGKYKVYNLCVERSYDKSCFNGSCVTYGFEDHNPPPLALIYKCCEDIHDYLKEDPERVAAIHCKAGKGRTGLIICCYLLFCGMFETATQALEFYGRARTHDGKGVTIPSQIRYTYYFSQYLRRPDLRLPTSRPPTYRLRHIRMHTVPNFDVGGGCDPYFDVRIRRKEDGGLVKTFDYKEAVGVKRIRNFMPKAKIVDIPLDEFDVRLCGDVRLLFWDYDRMSPPDKMFHIWINTYFVDNEYLCFAKAYIDGAAGDKSNKEFEPEFKVELFLDKAEALEHVSGEVVADDDEDGDDTDDDGDGDKDDDE